MNYREFLLPLLAMLVVALCGLSLRMQGLPELGLGFDELMHIYPAKALLETGDPIFPSGHIYERALLFTYTVALSFKLWGISELSARLPSVGFGVGTIILVFVIGRRFFGSGVGLIAACLVAFIPFELVWARASRMYSMYQFFYLLTFYSFYQGIESREGQYIIPGGFKKVSILDFVAGILGYLHVGWILTAVLAFSVAFHLHNLAAIFCASLLAYAGSMFFLSMLVPGVSFGIRAKYASLLVMLTIAGLGVGLWPGALEYMVYAQKLSPPWAEGQVLSIATYFNFLMMPSLLPILVFFILGVGQACTRLNKEAYYTVVCVGLPLVVHSLFANVQSPRYIYDFFPLVILVASWSIHNFLKFVKTSISDKIKSQWTNPGYTRSVDWGVTVFLMALICLAFYPGLRIAIALDRYQAADFGGQYHAQWREACDFVMKRFVEGEVIVASIPLNAEFSGCRHVEYNLDNGEIDQFFSPGSDGLPRHTFANAKAIVDSKGFQTVLARHSKGWILVDGQRFPNNANVPTIISTVISQNLPRQGTMADETIYVFHWTDGDRLKMLDELESR